MTISIVISLYNEEKGVLFFWENIKQEINKIPDVYFDLIWVNDGSRDSTGILLKNIYEQKDLKNGTNTIIEFSKNYGHEAAMLAGIENAIGDAIICMDSDGQHPPNKINNIINTFKNGAEIIMMERTQREDGGYFKNNLSIFFYKFINLISDINFQKNSSDFFLISKKIKDILAIYFRDKNRFLRGFIQSIGFNIVTLNFTAPAREYGESNYGLMNLIKLALNAIFSFSYKPLRISLAFSFGFLLFTFIFGIYTVYNYFVLDTIPSGYTTIMLFLTISFSLLFVTLSTLMLYFEKTIQELKNRPIYIIKEIIK